MMQNLDQQQKEQLVKHKDLLMMLLQKPWQFDINQFNELSEFLIQQVQNQIKNSSGTQMDDDEKMKIDDQMLISMVQNLIQSAETIISKDGQDGEANADQAKNEDMDIEKK